MYQYCREDIQWKNDISGFAALETLRRAEERKRAQQWKTKSSGRKLRAILSSAQRAWSGLRKAIL